MKKLAAIALSAVLALSLSVPAFAGAWKNDGIGWWYQKDDGSYPANQWFQESGDWYFFNYLGYRVDNAWIGFYYLGKDGKMLHDTVTPDGHRVGPDGKWLNASY